LIAGGLGHRQGWKGGQPRLDTRVEPQALREAVAKLRPIDAGRGLDDGRCRSDLFDRNFDDISEDKGMSEIREGNGHPRRKAVASHALKSISTMEISNTQLSSYEFQNRVKLRHERMRDAAVVGSVAPQANRQNASDMLALNLLVP
jgi:hypothetical protein